MPAFKQSSPAAAERRVLQRRSLGCQWSLGLLLLDFPPHFVDLALGPLFRAWCHHALLLLP